MPSSTSRSAIARPIPLAAPVTTATRSLSGVPGHLSVTTPHELPAHISVESRPPADGEQHRDQSARAWHDATGRAAFERGAHPARPRCAGGDAMSDRSEPEWASPNEVVLECPVAALRDFSQGSRKQRRPHAGAAAPGRPLTRRSSTTAPSRARCRRSAPPAWSAPTRWSGSARPRTPSTTASTTTSTFIERSVEHIGGPVNLIGDCQGGWLAAIYAALHPEQVNTLTLAGAPIDFHAGEGADRRVGRTLCSTGDMGFYEALVASGSGVMPGDYILGGFIAIKPENEIAKQLQLLANLDDPVHRAPLRGVRGLVQAHPGPPGRLLPVDRGGAVPRQQADLGRARGRRRRRPTCRA